PAAAAPSVGSARVLASVADPPFCTLARALDAPADMPDAERVRAFHEQAPGVWVAVGHRHPLAEQLRPPDGQILVLEPGRDWTFLDDAPFAATLDLFPLSPAAVVAVPVLGSTNLPVRPTLVRTGHDMAEPAELW